MWFNSAAVNGIDKSINNRDIVSTKMTPEQIAEAQQRAQTCLANNYKNC
jgi:hypothetical protein